MLIKCRWDRIGRTSRRLPPHLRLILQESSAVERRKRRLKADSTAFSRDLYRSCSEMQRSDSRGDRVIIPRQVFKPQPDVYFVPFDRSREVCRRPNCLRITVTDVRDMIVKKGGLPKQSPSLAKQQRPDPKGGGYHSYHL